MGESKLDADVSKLSYLATFREKRVLKELFSGGDLVILLLRRA